MYHLDSLIGALIPTALAVTLEQVGSTGPGVSQMWSQIMSIFPHTGDGTAGITILGTRVIEFILLLIGGTATGAIIYGAIKMIMSQGQDEGINEGKKIVLYALLGVVLAMLTDAIVAYVCVTLVPRLAGGAAAPQCSIIF